MIDIRAVLPSTVAVRSITNKFVKGTIQGNMLRDIIAEREQREQDERDRRVFAMTQKLRQEYGIQEKLESSQS